MKPPHIKAQRKREVRKLRKEERKVSRAIHNLGYIELEKPIRHGWYKHLRLREDIERRKDAAVFEEILEKCSSWVWGRDRKKELMKVWQIRAEKDRNWQYPGLRFLPVPLFKKLSPAAQKYFVKLERTNPYSRWPQYYHCLVPRYYYRTTYTKAFITQRKVIDASLERRMQEIEEILHRPEYYAEAYGWGYHPKWLRTWEHRNGRRKWRQALQGARDPESQEAVWVERKDCLY